MSNRPNHRRGEDRRTEHGPRFENPDPGAGCNSTHVARSRASWKRLTSRHERRTGSFDAGDAPLLSPRQRPENENPYEGWDEYGSPAEEEAP